MNNEIQFILYQLPDDEGKIQVVIKDETIWATQKAMAALFGVGVPDISKHLKKKFETGELDKNVVVSKMEIATPHGAIEGKTQMSETAFYNLDAIIAATTATRPPLVSSTRWFRTVFTTPSPAKRLLRSSTPVPTIRKTTWACRRGRTPLMAVYCRVSREQADRKAEEEYKLFNPTQKIDSDFDKEIRGLLDKAND